MYSKIKQFLDAAPKTLKSANEIYNFARNAYKKAMGFFPDGIDDIFQVQWVFNIDLMITQKILLVLIPIYFFYLMLMENLKIDLIK